MKHDRAARQRSFHLQDKSRVVLKMAPAQVNLLRNYLGIGSKPIQPPSRQSQESAKPCRSARTVSWLFFSVCLLVLFVNLGGPLLFEPDEGRNAEKAREILVLDDWITPHENFVPVLDKPMFFYWLVALSYKAFGVSEWAARLPSVLAALGSLLVIYGFACARWGPWQALWSGLILLSSVEFFLLARLAVSDMMLTLCTTLALCSFYAAVHAQSERARKIYCWVMYVALALGTLVKGLIALILPGMVYFVYLLLTQRWFVLRRLYLMPGALVYLAIVAPWYLWVDVRNPGYLRYYFWEEHFVRFASDEFDRSESWYYFLFVASVGFLPWTTSVPFVIRRLWRKLDDEALFLSLWAVLPFIFFSASKSQLPHYILPIFPALALLAGQAIVAEFAATRQQSRLLFLVWLIMAGFLVYVVFGTVWPNLLPRKIRFPVTENSIWIAAGAALLVAAYVVFAIGKAKKWWEGQRGSYIWASFSVSVFLIVVSQLLEPASLNRSSKKVAQVSRSLRSENSQMVLFDTYMTGLPFYLRIERPIWVVYPKTKTTLMDSPYISKNLPKAAAGYGKVLFTFEEFTEPWKESGHPFLIIVKAKNLGRLHKELGTLTHQLAVVDEYVLVRREGQGSLADRHAPRGSHLKMD
jgi:4-amino-4-deoxy-L-arabinose transferase-like glycosyltransferase